MASMENLCRDNGLAFEGSIDWGNTFIAHYQLHKEMGATDGFNLSESERGHLVELYPTY